MIDSHAPTWYIELYCTVWLNMRLYDTDPTIYDDSSSNSIDEEYTVLPSDDALTRSCYIGDARMVELLLDNPEIDPAANNNEAIRLASMKGHDAVVQLLIEDVRVEPVPVCLADACYGGHTDVVISLIGDIRVNPNGASLLNACRQGYRYIVDILLTCPRKRITPDTGNEQALLAAVRSGDCKVVRMLLDAGFDPNIDNGVALITAIDIGYDAITNELLDDDRTNPSLSNSEALALACTRGYISIVERILSDARVDPTAQNNKAVVSAFQHNRGTIAAMLLRLIQGTEEPDGAMSYKFLINPSIRGNSLIYVAAANGNCKLVRMLLEDPRVNPNDERYKPVRAAIHGGHVDILDMLLQDPRIENTIDYKAEIEMAAIRGRLVMKKLLKHHRRRLMLKKLDIRKYIRGIFKRHK